MANRREPGLLPRGSSLISKGQGNQTKRANANRKALAFEKKRPPGFRESQEVQSSHGQCWLLLPIHGIFRFLAGRMDDHLEVIHQTEAARRLR